MMGLELKEKISDGNARPSGRRSGGLRQQRSALPSELGARPLATRSGPEKNGNENRS
jgi:hypothetical protein